MRLRALTALPLLAALLAAAHAAACDDASFEFRLNLAWSPFNDAAYPGEAPGVGFTAVVCAVHNARWQLWAPLAPASTALVAMASERDPSAAVATAEAGRAAGDVLDFVVLPKAGGGKPDAKATEPVVKGVSNWNVTLKADSGRGMRFLTCAAGIVPSPDFFVGMSQYEVCTDAGSFTPYVQEAALLAWDAGTDSGETYDAPDAPAAEPTHVQSLLGFATRYGSFSVRGLGETLNVEDGGKGSEGDDDGGSACFPADEMLHTHGGGFLPMHAVRVGHAAAAPFTVSAAQAPRADRVPIVLMSHADATRVSAFVALRTASTTLRISPGHYLPVASALKTPTALRTASRVAPGDYILAADGARMRVLSTTRTTARGLYAPHTHSGALVVAGVQVSCYTDALHPVLAQAGVCALASAPRVAEALQALLESRLGGVVYGGAAWLRPLFGGPGALR